MWRSVLAVILGYTAIGALVVATDTAWAHAVPGFRNMAEPPMRYFIASLATDSIYSIIGGWVCAMLAGAASRRQAVVGLIVFGEVVGLATMLAMWKIVPHWFGVGLLILYPPCIWLGSRLRSAKA